MNQKHAHNKWQFAAGLCILAIIGCTINPATGQRQLTLLSEAQEIEMGRQAHPEIVATYGAYPDEGWQEYIQRLGSELAASSERPHLDWTFTVLDDPVVNAMALPGGYIYVNRGILAHFNSEAELASVLGHEIGHVTARHSVEQLSRMQLANLGLGVATVVSEDFRQYAGVASQGVSILFLKFGRDDESQADDLGLRYMTRTGFDPHEMPKVFNTLDRVSSAHGGQSMPSWLSTHPDPGDRATSMGRKIEQLPPEERQGTVGRAEYMQRLAGMSFGTNPREGYSIGRTFYHPDLEFKLRFPEGWQIVNQRNAVGALSPQKDAVVVLTLAREDSPNSAAQSFFAQQGIERGSSWRRNFHAFRTVDTSTGERRSQGLVGFVRYRERVYQLLGYSVIDSWEGYRESAQRSLASFGSLTDRKYINVDSKKIEIVKLPRAMTLSEFMEQYPSTVDAATIAVLNGIDVSDVFEKGSLVKRIKGGKLPKN
jgi:predicted Zn-dependent protease